MTVENLAKAKSYLYDQVSVHIQGLVETGVLKPGDKAPSLRKLSRQLKVSISTVQQAYVGLEQLGLLKVKPQSGFYIHGGLQKSPALSKKTTVCCKPRKVKFSEIFEEVFIVANNPDIVPLGAAKASMELMPVKGLIRATNRVASSQSEAALDYCFPPGNADLRQQIARRYMDIGLNVSPDDVIVTSGATEALALCLQTLARRGDVIAVDSPTYFSMLRLIERMGMLALEIDTDPETGICLDAMENALETMDIKAVLTVSNFSNPIGSLMPDENKKRLVQLLEQYQVPLIEDDVYGDLFFGDTRPSLAKHYDTQGLVLTCSSFSKTLAPGYRIGWVIAQSHYDDILEWKQATTSAVASLPQLAVVEFLRSGEYERHLVRLRRAYQEQVEKMRFMIAKYFPENTRVSRPKGGFVLWLEMPRGVDCLDVFNQALEQGISITPGILFSATRRYRNFIRINCGFPWSDVLENGVICLADIVKRLSKA